MTSSSSSEPPSVHQARGYVYACLLVGLAAAARWGLTPWLGNSVPFATFFAAVVAATWLGGLGPGVLASCLGLLAGVLLFVPPDATLRTHVPTQLLGLALYAIVCAAITAFGEGMWRGRRRVQQRERLEREQRALLRLTLGSIGDAVITTDAGGRVTYLNPVAESLTGWSAADAPGQPVAAVFRIVNEQTRMPVDDPVARVLAEGRTVGLANHTVLIARDGVERPIDDSAAPIRDDDGVLVGAVLVFRDVTARKRTEEQLERQAQMFRAIADSTSELIYVKDREHRLLFANTATLEAIGLPASEALGAPQHTLHLSADELAAVSADDDRVLASGEGDTGEVSVTMPQGRRSYLWSKTPMRDAAGRVTGLVGITRDITERKAAEARLAESEARFRLLADAMPQIVYVTEPDGRVTFINRRWTEFSGQSEAQRADLSALVHPDDLPAMLRAWEQAMATGTPFQAEFRLRRVTDGAYRWFLTRAVPVTDATGAVLRWNGTSTDIHDQKLSEEAARASEARFRALFETMDEGFCVIDVLFDDSGRAVDYRFVEANPAFERHTGLSNVVGRTVREFVPTHEAYWFETYGRVARSGESIRFAHRAEALGGRWFDVYAFRLGDGGARRVAVLFTDITARAVADEVARDRSEQLRGLATVLPRISATTDLRSIMGVVTAEARRLVDAGAARAMYLRDDDWTRAIDVTAHRPNRGEPAPGDDLPSRQDLHALVCRGNAPVRLTAEELAAHPAFVLPEPATRPPLTSWLAVPLIGRDGRNMGALQLTDKVEGAFTADDEAVLLQVAQMASVAIDNARLVDDLQVADRRKDEFLSVLAHELRNPLAPLRSGLHLMKTAHDPATVTRVRAIMDRQVTQMVRLIDDLMDLTRISRGKLVLQKAQVLLQEVLRIAVETSRPLIEQGSHTLTLDIPDAPITVEADETRLAQVFANLLNNAAKYTPPGGRIRLAVRSEAEAVVVTVEDNGIGIPADMLGQVFDMFTQVDQSLEKSQGGLGIGLNIARRLVEKHGGRISADSGGAGLGSRFVVRLPLGARLSVTAHRQDESSPGAPGPRRRVLVVDDNADAAASIDMVFTALGHDTRTAADGREAVAVAERFRPELILMDIGMPLLNGYDACRQIRQQPWAAGVTIVACTGWGQDDDRQRSRAAGFDHHLVKPPLPAALEQLVASLPAPPDDQARDA